MTTEQDNQRVSDVYREIATQKTPTDLDDKILKLAAGAVPSRYGVARAWVRPLAWAATIALSLAIVLEINRGTEVPVAPVRDDLAATRTDPGQAVDRARGGADLMKAKEEKDAQHGIAAKHAPASAPVPVVVDAEDMAQLPEVGASVRQQSADEAEGQIASEERIAADTFADAPTAAAEAEPVAAELSVTASRARANVSHLVAPDEETYCDAEARASAEGWYACVEALRDEGLIDAADSELEALREAFPDFVEGRE